MTSTGVTDSGEGVYLFFLKARDAVITHGYAHEVEWCQNRQFERVTPHEFLMEYMFAVFCSSGLNNKVVQGMMDKFLKAMKDGTNAFETIKNQRMRDAITEMWTQYHVTLAELQSKPTDAEKIAYLATLRQIGKKEKFHLARNLGIDCVKPDIHMERLAETFGFATPLAMCQEIQKFENERLGVIDVILWRYCNLTGDYGKGA